MQVKISWRCMDTSFEGAAFVSSMGLKFVTLFNFNEMAYLGHPYDKIKTLSNYCQEETSNFQSLNCTKEHFI